MKIDLDSKSLTLRSNPNVSHDDAAEMYNCYGAHISTDEHGDICVQAVEYDWMDSDKDAETFRSERLAEYGAEISDEQRQEIDEIADYSDDYALLMTRWESFQRRSRALDWETCESLVELARRIRGDMEPIADELERAACAAVDGDLETCIEALQSARNMETDHGDDPSTSSLASQLLEEIEEARQKEPA